MKRLTRNAALAGLASLAVAGAAWAAETPAKPQVQVMEVALPDGGVARISYSGAIAPQVTVAPAAKGALPAGLDARFDMGPFAAMDRIMADMDARAATMLREMRDMEVRMAAAARAAETGDPQVMRWASLPGFGPAAAPIAVASLPPGAVSYSAVTTVNGGRSCTQTVQVTRSAADAAPQVVRRASGDCGKAADTAPAASNEAPDHAAPAARTIAAPKPVKPQASPPPNPREVI
jgi:hypothetical protein